MPIYSFIHIKSYIKQESPTKMYVIPNTFKAKCIMWLYNLRNFFL